MAVDLYINKEALNKASREMQNWSSQIFDLQKDINVSFGILKKDWDSDAGKAFFDKFEHDLIKNLGDYAKVFSYISTNLSTASQKYEEVFREADTVARARY